MVDIILSNISSLFSIEYMISVIIASYFVIKGVDLINGNKAVKGWIKRIITLGVGAISFWVFYSFAHTPIDTLMASYFAAVFFYDSAIKYLIQKLDIDYKK